MSRFKKNKIGVDAFLFIKTFFFSSRVSDVRNVWHHPGVALHARGGPRPGYHESFAGVAHLDGLFVRDGGIFLRRQGPRKVVPRQVRPLGKHLNKGFFFYLKERRRTTLSKLKPFYLVSHLMLLQSFERN